MKKKNKIPIIIPNQDFYTKNRFYFGKPGESIKQEKLNDDNQKKLSLKNK
jgi:hypothetical protein